MTNEPPEGSEFGTPPGLASLRFDPDAIALRDPSLLLDPQFLGALHVELVDELGDSAARIALFQMGFLHGLQDAIAAVDQAFETGSPSSMTPLLAIRMGSRVGGDGSEDQRASIAINGEWPERAEASAVLQTQGRPDFPVCYVSAGYTSGWLSGTLEANILAIESSCSGCGATSCSFDALEADIWQAQGHPLAQELLAALPFDALRRFIRRGEEHDETSRIPTFGDDTREPSQFDQPHDESVVHIWGPVMVVPFADSDDALRALETIRLDPATREVSVVVIDLSKALIDDAFGAVALEQIIDTIEGWDAEVILAGVTPLSEPAIADLERAPLFIMKDLPQAIASAFQIADAQRRPT